MQVGDLVRIRRDLTAGGLNQDLCGIILDIYEDPDGEFGAKLLSVLWSDGDKCEEFPVDLEVICK